MTTNKILLAIGAVFIVGLIATTAFADTFGYNQNNNNMKGQGNRQANYESMQEHRVLVQEAIENNDYNAWQSAMQNSPRSNQMQNAVNEDNFNKVVEMHNARLSGDFETANNIASELGIAKGFGNRQNIGRDNAQGRHSQNFANCPLNLN